MGCWVLVDFEAFVGFEEHGEMRARLVRNCTQEELEGRQEVEGMQEGPGRPVEVEVQGRTGVGDSWWAQGWL